MRRPLFVAQWQRPRRTVRNQFRSRRESPPGRIFGDTPLSLLSTKNAGQAGFNRITQTVFSTLTWYTFAGWVKAGGFLLMNGGKLGSRPTSSNDKRPWDFLDSSPVSWPSGGSRLYEQ